MRAGQRLKSVVSDTEVIVTRAPADDAIEITCGGARMLDVDIDAPRQDPPEGDEATLLGKRYVSEDKGLELLCTKGGQGSLAADGETLTIKGAKPLPASD